jgi:RNA polymerase-binding transcription factor DksA
MAAYSLSCLDCGAEIPLHRPDPRVPLCDECKDLRCEKARRTSNDDEPYWSTV